MDFILWTSEFFTATPSKALPNSKLFEFMFMEDDLEFTKKVDDKVVPCSPPPNLERPANKELTLLFQVLYSMCVPSIEGGTTESTAINKGILSILLDLFNTDIRQSPDNIRARGKLWYLHLSLSSHFIVVLSPPSYNTL